MTSFEPTNPRMQNAGSEYPAATPPPPPTTAPPGGSDDRTFVPREPMVANGDAVVTVVEDRPLKDLVRWGPVWAGLVIAVGSYLVLQLALVASGLVDLPTNGTEDGLWSAAAALVAFLLGGLTAAATAAWRGVGDGILHGLVMWAVALVVLLALAGVGSGIALGSLDTSQIFKDLTSTVNTTRTQSDAQDAAGWALLGLGAALLASVIGGAIGAKLWPHRDASRMSRTTTTR